MQQTTWWLLMTCKRSMQKNLYSVHLKSFFQLCISLNSTLRVDSTFLYCKLQQFLDKSELQGLWIWKTTSQLEYSTSALLTYYQHANLELDIQILKFVSQAVWCRITNRWNAHIYNTPNLTAVVWKVALVTANATENVTASYSTQAKLTTQPSILNANREFHIEASWIVVTERKTTVVISNITYTVHNSLIKQPFCTISLLFL